MAKELELAGTEIRTGEKDLLEGLRQGNLPAFERLFEEHGERMKSIALNLTNNIADAEDAVQETFLKMYRGAGKFRGGSSLSTWAYRILVNACYDLMRKNRRRAEAPLPAHMARATGEADHPLRLSIEVAVQRLDPRERAAFFLAQVEGFSHREVGEILEIPEGTSRTLVFRAKRRLQQQLRAGGAFLPAEAS